MKFLIDNAWRKLKAGTTTVEEVLSLGFQKADDAASLTRNRRGGETIELDFDKEPPEGATIDFDANPPE
jgi:hypothetical protein